MIFMINRDKVFNNNNLIIKEVKLNFLIKKAFSVQVAPSPYSFTSFHKKFDSFQS